MVLPPDAGSGVDEGGAMVAMGVKAALAVVAVLVAAELVALIDDGGPLDARDDGRLPPPPTDN